VKLPSELAVYADAISMRSLKVGPVVYVAP
jgi:hypothetical protein